MYFEQHSRAGNGGQPTELSWMVHHYGALEPRSKWSVPANSALRKSLQFLTVLQRSPERTGLSWYIHIFPCTTTIGISSPAMRLQPLEPRSRYPQPRLTVKSRSFEEFLSRDPILDHLLIQSREDQHIVSSYIIISYYTCTLIIPSCLSFIVFSELTSSGKITGNVNDYFEAKDPDNHDIPRRTQYYVYILPNEDRIAN